MLLDDVVVVADSNYWLTGWVCVLLGQNLLRVHMKTQIPIIATRCINICPTRLKHDHYDGPALSLHARAPPRRAARAPCRSQSPARPDPGEWEQEPGAGPVMSCSALDCDPGPVSQSRFRAESIARRGPAGRTVTGLLRTGPTQSGLTSPTTMLWSPLSLSTSRNNVIISPDPTQAIHSHIALTHSELCKVRRLE